MGSQAPIGLCRNTFQLSSLLGSSLFQILDQGGDPLEGGPGGFSQVQAGDVGRVVISTLVISTSVE